MNDGKGVKTMCDFCELEKHEWCEDGCECGCVSPEEVA